MKPIFVPSIIPAIALTVCLAGCSGGASGSSAGNTSSSTSSNLAVKTIHLTGTAPAAPGAEITVDGKPARILADGSWEIDLPLPATTTVTVRFAAPGIASQEKTLSIKR